MMAEKLRDIVRKSKTGETKFTSDSEKVDMEKVERIVQKMRNKYSSDGVKYGEQDGKMAELRGIISNGEGQQLEVQKIEDLKESDNKLVSGMGSLFLRLGGITGAFYSIFEKFPLAQQLEFYLYSANMRYSGKQWLALTTISSLIVFVIILIVMVLLIPLLNLSLEESLPLIILMPLGAFCFFAIVMMLIPKQRAQARGKAISRELPFALRHIATQLSAGIGLYRTLQTVASADYGPLSEEFSRTITEVEEGTDTQDALRHLALRTQSTALRNALMHTIRALKTGGNLSHIMNDIADDVSFDLRVNMREFGEKMNFMGVMFIFMAIVLPVFVAILGGVRNSPIMASSLFRGSGGGFSSIPLPIDTMFIFFLVAMPGVLLWLFLFIKLIQPHV